MAKLVPYPFGALVGRMFRELDRNRAIFDLPERKFFLGDPGHDLAVRFHGREVSSPLGPAAGPQTQMAQNIVLSWLAGARILELKTVQVLDELKIPRPCIDMQTIGFNAEWSQELRLDESLGEYVKGAMLVEILKASGQLELAPGFDRVVYDMSVGYDLAGIRSERVQGFIRGMLDAREVVDQLRREIPAALREFRELSFANKISDTVTLSTFHGCPPEEIESIIDFLMRELGLNCVIKFNPMLLGKTETLRLLHDTLGYRDIRVPDSAFEQDTRWEEAVEIVDRLGRTAASLGLRLSVKLTNTLIVQNDRGFLPSSEKDVYLSGAPLHVLAMHLVARFRRHFGDRFPISFSAGIDRSNFADAVALGLVPITVCSDLLKPQGYGRLPGYYKELVRRMDEVGARTIDDFILRAYGKGEGRSVAEAKLLNTEHYAAAVAAGTRYAKARHSKLPHKIGRRLRLFDCISCDKCIPVCPNDANFAFVPARPEVPVVKLRRRGAGWEWREEETIVLAEEHQIGTFADFCNECGNCDIFCPEDGGPYLLKPRFFGSEAGWRELPLDGFYVERRGGRDRVLGRFGGAEYALEVAGGRYRCAGPGFEVTYRGADPAGTVEGDGPDEVNLTQCQIMDCLRRGLLDTDQVNYVNSLWAEEGAER